MQNAENLNGDRLIPNQGPKTVVWCCNEHERVNSDSAHVCRLVPEIEATPQVEGQGMRRIFNFFIDLFTPEDTTDSGFRAMPAVSPAKRSPAGSRVKALFWTGGGILLGLLIGQYL